MSAPQPYKRRHQHWWPAPIAATGPDLFAPVSPGNVGLWPHEIAPTYSGDLDGERLQKLLQATYALMLDGRWRTLGEICAIVGHTEGGIGARLRQIRRLDAQLKKLPKSAPVVHVVARRRRGDPKAGLWEYSLRAP